MLTVSFIKRLLVSLVLLLLIPTTSLSSQNDQQLWLSLKQPNHFAFMRHANAPGTGDPQDFTLGKCETQRNLSSEGRKQAQRIGEQFRNNGITQARIYSSQWCRCTETAMLLNLGEITTLPVINSFFREYDRRDIQTKNLQLWLKDQELQEITILVSHQVNITALTGIFPASGEIVVIRKTISEPEDFEVVGTIKID